MKPVNDAVWEALRTKKWQHSPSQKHLAEELRASLSTLPIFFLDYAFHEKDDAALSAGALKPSTETVTGWEPALPYQQFITVNTRPGRDSTICILRKLDDNVVTQEVHVTPDGVMVFPVAVVLSTFGKTNTGLATIMAQPVGDLDVVKRHIGLSALGQGAVDNFLQNVCEINTASMRNAEIPFVPRRDPGQAARARVAAQNRKLPTWEYKLVEIKPAEPSAGPQGGTHASPRQHERRGHWRQYKSGKRVWIAAQIVGDPSRGVVKHSYVVGSAV